MAPQQQEEPDREIVVPGDLLDDSGRLKAGFNTYKEGPHIYALRLGMKQVRGDMISVIALSGRYDPQRNDLIIATVLETGPSIWLMDINAASPVTMHVNDVPWKVDFGETSKFMASGDTVLLKVAFVDEIKKIQLTMKDRACRKLAGGLVFEVAPSKVPRIIGRGGSMTNLIKDATNTRMFVGQNGVIWIDGEPGDVALAMAAIRKVEEEAHLSGLTDKIKAFLEQHRRQGMHEWKRATLEKERGPRWA
ncbi:MAG TPA: exosome complex RNA-binding protein Rrp4 [Candidatus Thermoplasmatota archaeon]|jgi:exosome complex component RRP4|nr:exosome complex RNA-binding protein Rrp4 [Candidatus Thermoplasmatota archaeon]